MTLTKKTLAFSALVASVLASAPAMAELSANVAVTSNYVFRGFTQTDDGAALQGGLDYAHETGLYAGVWGSNVDKGLEYDLYAGYAGSVGDFGYDLAYLTYNYTDSDFYDGMFKEFKVAGSYGPVIVAYYIGQETAFDTDYTYLDLGASFDLPMEATLGLHYGIFDPDVAGQDNVNDYSVSVGKDFEQLAGANVSLTFTKEDAGDESEVFLTVKKSFDL
jgi:uncharacterized protein (TIGR02001 family)